MNPAGDFLSYGNSNEYGGFPPGFNSRSTRQTKGGGVIALPLLLSPGKHQTSGQLDPKCRTIREDDYADQRIASESKTNWRNCGS